MKNVKFNMVLVSGLPRRQAKLTGTTNLPSYGAFNEVVLFVAVGVVTGSLATIFILRPDLINWVVFSRTFTNSLLFGAIAK